MKKEPRCENCKQPKVSHTFPGLNCPMMANGNWVGWTEMKYQPRKD